MTAPTIRIRLSNNDQQKLEELAESFGYTHGGKPSLTGLLKAIAQEDLQIHDGSVDSQSIPNEQLYMLTVEAPFSLNGVVASVTQIFGKAKCNIVWLTAKHKDESMGILNICFSLNGVGEEVLGDIFDDLSSIKYQEIDKYNDFRNNEDKMLEIYNALLDRRLVVDVPYKDKMKELKDTNLICKASLSIGLHVFACSEAGTVGRIAGKIAESKIMISSIELVSNLEEETDEILAFLQVVLISNSRSDKEDYIRDRVGALTAMKDNLKIDFHQTIQRIEFAQKVDWIRLMNASTSSRSF